RHLIEVLKRNGYKNWKINVTVKRANRGPRNRDENPNEGHEMKAFLLKVPQIEIQNIKVDLDSKDINNLCNSSHDELLKFHSCCPNYGCSCTIAISRLKICIMVARNSYKTAANNPSLMEGEKPVPLVIKNALATVIKGVNRLPCAENEALTSQGNMEPIEDFPFFLTRMIYALFATLGVLHLIIISTMLSMMTQYRANFSHCAEHSMPCRTIGILHPHSKIASLITMRHFCRTILRSTYIVRDRISQHPCKDSQFLCGLPKKNINYKFIDTAAKTTLSLEAHQ
ncbi:hypothetical protein KI387_032280, partial [Taxus chinensis]